MLHRLPAGRPSRPAAPQRRSKVVRAVQQEYEPNRSRLSHAELSATKSELLSRLAELENRWGRSAALLPPQGADETRGRINELLEKLEDSCAHFRQDEASTSTFVDPNVLGDWELVYASNGTVVTRTGLAQVLAAGAQQLPFVGLGDIVQRLSTDNQGVIQTSNEAVFGLGPFGEWRVAVDGVWRNKGDGRTVDVVFDKFRLQPISFLGLKLPTMLPQLVVGGGDPVRDTRGGAEWVTTYVDEDLRIGKGRKSSNLFVFRRRPSA